MLIDPLAAEQHALLATSGAEIARLVGEGEQDIVPTGIAVDAREAVVRIGGNDWKEILSPMNNVWRQTRKSQRRYSETRMDIGVESKNV